LLGKLKEMLRRYDSQPVGRVIVEINPILRGWVNYVRIGNAGEEASGLRLEEVAYGGSLRNAGVTARLQRPVRETRT
jgi:hypothetical protein